MSGIVGLLTRRLIVNISGRSFTFLGRRREGIVSEGLMCRFLWLLVLAVLVAGVATRADAQSTPVISAGPNLPYAYSDLDVDPRPCLAVVQSGRSDVSFTHYWVPPDFSCL